ncbi:hypothetical protein [Modestobacter sp. SSW1-42]|uniref:hypothetical protein n=1 Tax=Modestobacter sp. SSW1-42 TaxID=596372 RepID=UPI003986A60E
MAFLLPVFTGLAVILTALGGAAQLDAKYTSDTKEQPDFRKSLPWGWRKAVLAVHRRKSRQLSSRDRENGGVALRFFGSCFAYVGVLISMVAWTIDQS